MYIFSMKNIQRDPFKDRISWDIRNDLSASLTQAMKEKDIAPALSVAERYLKQGLASCYTDYIQDRLSGYRTFLDCIRQGPNDIFWQALVLWDQKLFFEVHEVLEHAWLKSGGAEKLVLQAMIRAAGVYIKLEYGYRESARKIANRALPILEKHKEFLAAYFEPEKLLRCLKDFNLPPPDLLDSLQQYVR